MCIIENDKSAPKHTHTSLTVHQSRNSHLLSLFSLYYVASRKKVTPDWLTLVDHGLRIESTNRNAFPLFSSFSSPPELNYMYDKWFRLTKRYSLPFSFSSFGGCWAYFSFNTCRSVGRLALLRDIDRMDRSSDGHHRRRSLRLWMLGRTQGFRHCHRLRGAGHKRSR